jgi:hypothetical protein
LWNFFQLFLVFFSDCGTFFNCFRPFSVIVELFKKFRPFYRQPHIL